MARQSTIPVRVGFYDYPHNRNATSAKDAYFKNCWPERVEGGTQETTRYEVVKRPGLGTAVYARANATARGMYIWQGNVYDVLGNQVYKNGSSIGSTISTSTGRVYWEQMGGGSGSAKLLLLAGQDIYSIKADNTVTVHSGGTQASSQIGTVTNGIANLDGYMFVCDTDGKILHNNTQNDTSANMSWSNASIISANVFSDGLQGVCRHLNYIVGIGDWSTEFFYNAGNTSGSILSRAEGTVIRYGTPNFDTLWQDENLLVWVARSRDGGNCVIVLDGLTPKIVSTKAQERILNSYAIDTAYAYGARILGHVFYFLTIPDADKTLVFSLTDNMWHEWTSYDGTNETYFKGYDMRGYIDSGGSISYLVQHETNGDIYPLEFTSYEDAGNIIKVKLVTDKIDFQTNQRKFCRHLHLMSNRIENTTAVNIGMRYTDDDYKTWRAAGDKDIRYIPTWKALGSFNRRAFEFTFEENYPLRIENLEFGLGLGSYAQGRL